MHKKFYRLDSKGKIRLWEIKVTGNLIETWDGVLDGRLKYTPDEVSKGKNIGKANETTPEEQALKEAKRKIELKVRKGYSEKMPEGQPEFNEEFFNNPPRNFVGPKPLNKMPDALRQEKEEDCKLEYTRKWNGMCVHIVYGYDEKVRIFTSQMDEKTEIFPWQVEEMEGIFGPGTWLMAEAELDDDPDKMKTIFGSLTEKAIAEQEKMGHVKFHVYNMLFQGGVQIDWPWKQRVDFAQGEIDRHLTQYIDTVMPVAYDAETALEIIRKEGWEGCVIWDIEHESMPIKWGGAPSRKCGAWKLKNFKEADVLIVGWESGKGKLNNGVATLTYGAYDSNGNIVILGRGGSGLDGEKRQEIREATLPIVAEVKYEEITKGGKFRLPVILRLRFDKSPSECLVEDIQR